MTFLNRGGHRTANERDLYRQHAILSAAIALRDLGGTAEQIKIASRAVRMAEGRRNMARNRVNQDRMKERQR